MQVTKLVVAVVNLSFCALGKMMFMAASEVLDWQNIMRVNGCMVSFDETCIPE